MKKTLATILTVVMATIFMFGASGCLDGDKVPYNKELAANLKKQVQEIDGKLIMSENETEKAALTTQKKEALIKLGEEYAKNYDPQDYSKADDVFEEAIMVYRELPKLIDIKTEGKSALIETLGRYIRKNIQIIFLSKNFKESYRLAKEMYQIGQSNAGNENLYADSATGLGDEAFQKKDYEQALKYAQEATTIGYHEKALDLFIKSSIELAGKTFAAGDYAKTKQLLTVLPETDDAEYSKKAKDLWDKLAKVGVK